MRRTASGSYRSGAGAQTIDALFTALLDGESQRATLAHSLADANDVAMRLAAENAAQQRVAAEHASQVEILGQRMGEFELVVAQRDQAIAELEAKLEELKAERVRVDGALAAADARLATILSSRSWALTAPLRAITRLARRLGGRGDSR